MHMKTYTLVTIMALAACAACANVWHKGQPVHGASTAICPVDMLRLMWGSDELKTGDRIQGQIMLNKNAPRQGNIKIIIQGVAASGELLNAYALNTDFDTRDLFAYDSDSRDDFYYGFTHVMFKEDRRYDRASRKVDPGWFYFDFEKDPDIKNFLIINVVLDGQEVAHNLRLVDNRLLRTLTALPQMKRRHKGEFSQTTEWIPPFITAKKAESKSEKKADAPNTGKRQAGMSQTGVSLTEKNDEISGETVFSANINWAWKSNGADFSFVPSVTHGGTTSFMSILLKGNALVSTGYTPRLAKILLFDPTTKERLTIDDQNTVNWPRFSLTTRSAECRLELPPEAIAFFAKAGDIRGRLSFEHSDSAAGRNFDHTFSKEQVEALRKLAEKCLSLQTGTSN